MDKRRGYRSETGSFSFTVIDPADCIHYCLKLPNIKIINSYSFELVLQWRSGSHAVLYVVSAELKSHSAQVFHSSFKNKFFSSKFLEVIVVPRVRG